MRAWVGQNFASFNVPQSTSHELQTVEEELDERLLNLIETPSNG